MRKIFLFFVFLIFVCGFLASRGGVVERESTPSLVLEYIEHADLLGTSNGWEGKPLYFEPVSVIKFGSGVIRNDGGVDAINVSVWMVFGNSTNNWTVGIVDKPFDVSAGDKYEGLCLDELDLGNESEMGGIIYTGEYFIEFHANYTYWNGSMYVNESRLLYVERLRWGEKEVGGFYRGNASVALRDVDVDVIYTGRWPPEIVVHVEYDGHVPVNVSVSVNGSVERIREYIVEHIPPELQYVYFGFTINALILLSVHITAILYTLSYSLIFSRPSVPRMFLKMMMLWAVFIVFSVILALAWITEISIPTKRISVVEGIWAIERVENISSSGDIRFEMVESNGSHAENGYRCEVRIEYGGYREEILNYSGDISPAVEEKKGIYSMFPSVPVPVIIELYSMEMPVAVVIGFLLSRIIARKFRLKKVDRSTLIFSCIFFLIWYMGMPRCPGRIVFPAPEYILERAFMCMIYSVITVVVSCVLVMICLGREENAESEEESDEDWYPGVLVRFTQIHV